MNKIIILFAACLLLAVSSSAQTRTFDNFDMRSGVNVIKPPAPPVQPKKTVRKKINGKWEVVTIDNTPVAAAKSQQLVKKTVQTKPVMPVTDGLATREGMTSVPSAKSAMGTGRELKGFTTGDPIVDSYIVESSRRWGVDPLLIYSQMHQESTFKSRALSPKGASGLMQLMPDTARRFGVDKIWDQKQNIEGGVHYMRWLLDTFNGDVVLALAGYNAGEGAVMKYGWQVPPYRETQEYVRRITNTYSQVTDGRYVLTARSVNGKVQEKETRPLTVWQPDSIVVRDASGNMRLVNQ